MRGIPGYRIVKLLPRGEDKYVRILCRELDKSRPAAEGESLLLFPGSRSLRIKQTEKNQGGTVLAVRGVSRAELLPGACIIPSAYPVSEERDVLVFSDGKKLPSGSELVRGGIHPGFNRERLVGRAFFRADGSFFHIRFPRPYPVMPGMVLSILSGGGEAAGEAAVRNFNLLYAGMPSAAEMRRLNASAKRRPEKHPEEREIFLRLLYLKGFVCLPPELVELPWKGAAVLGRWAVLEEEKLFLERKIRKLCLRPGGAEEAFLSVDERPRELLQSIAQCMLSEGVLIRRGKWLFPEGAPPLSPYHRSWLDRVAAEGPEGLRISGLKSSADIRVLEELGRSELIFGGSSLWLSGPEYSKCRSKLLNGFKQGDVLTMAEARERLAGSRAVTLEVLEVLEKEGFLSSPEHGQRRVLR